MFAAVPAHADVHGSLGAGGAFVLTGHGDDRYRLEAAASVTFGNQLGAIVAWRAFDEDHAGLVMAGIVYEGAAARPRIVLDLHAELGLDLDITRPLVGGGLRTTLGIVGPLGLALDTGAYLVIDGVDDTRLQLQSSAAVVVIW